MTNETTTYFSHGNGMAAVALLSLTRQMSVLNAEVLSTANAVPSPSSSSSSVVNAPSIVTMTTRAGSLPNEIVYDITPTMIGEYDTV